MIVYRHRRLDTNQIFYVGIGTLEKRAYSKYNRNKHWKHIVDKVGYTVEIIAEVDSWEEACELEQFLIQEYGRRDLGTGTLCNLTDGGDGSLRREPWNKGKKIPEISGENHPRYGKSLSEEHKLLLYKARKGRKDTEETINKKILNSGKAKKVINIVTNEIFNSAKDAAKSINAEYNHFRKKLTGVHKNNTNFKYLDNE